MSAAGVLHTVATSIAKRKSLFQGLCGGCGDDCRCHDGNGNEGFEQRVELHCGFETCSLRDWGEWVEWVGYFISFTSLRVRGILKLQARRQDSDDSQRCTVVPLNVEKCGRWRTSFSFSVSNVIRVFQENPIWLWSPKNFRQAFVETESLHMIAAQAYEPFGGDIKNAKHKHGISRAYTQILQETLSQCLIHHF